jgi:seryl-tRNA synthetase
MFDIKAIRLDPAAFDRGMAARGLPPAAGRLLALDERLRAIITALQEDQARRNDASKAIGKAKASGDEKAAQALIEEVSALKTRIQENEDAERRLGEELREALTALPNLPLDDVPVGPDESANVEYRRHGEAPAFDFAPKAHDELGERLGMMDFGRAAKVSGARFVVLESHLSRLERALAAFMLDIHTREFGYREVSPPLLVREEAMFGTGQLPKFREEQYQTDDGLWLVPTAEVPLTNLVRESILDEEALPLRYTAFTPCFRKEAGAAGRDTRGMIRQHQFSKVELVAVTAPEHSLEEHERMLTAAETVLQRLGIAYRVMLLSSGDMGFAAARTYDIEVWLPSQETYREISSVSLCGDFQARRMNARYRPAEGKGTRYVHTLNGSGLAVGRALIAVLENYQRADGSIAVPDALRPYFGNLSVIAADE